MCEELDTILKEVVVAYFKILFYHFREGTEETHSQDSQ
jgi:hypothetical protein